jgi:hypothetical protein
MRWHMEEVCQKVTGVTRSRPMKVSANPHIQMRMLRSKWNPIIVAQTMTKVWDGTKDDQM